ncbi:MAG: manganese efflux pump [Clostridia bacterium]|nr:manganese efflux pump [Clostridia bacterium]
MFCLLGGTLGRHLGKAFGKWSGVAGGIVLIAIGIKTFLEHILG